MKMYLKLILCFILWVSQAHAATYSFRNDPYVYDTPSGGASTVTWHAGTDGTWLPGPACTSYSNGDDDWSDISFPAGFNFTFAGTAYSGLRIYANGQIVFGPDISGFHRDYGSQALPVNSAGTPGIKAGTPTCTYSAAPRNTMFLYWLDIVAGSAKGVTGASIKYEMLGTAPNRRFVITYDNVALYSGPTTRYTFQVALFENASGINGPFEFRYTSGSSTGLGAAVGVQVSTTDYTQYAFNQAFIDTAIGTNIHWYPQTTLASAGGVYGFNEASWTGAAGQIIDSSGNVPALNGQSLGSAATSNTTKCGTGRSGSFPANTSNTVISAVQLPITPSNTGSIDFWYYSNAKWNANPATTLFDATTVANRPFYLMKTAAGALQFTTSDNAGTIQTTTTGNQTFAANTWQHVGVSWSFLLGTNQTLMQIFINGVLTTSTRYTTTGTIAPLSTINIGDNRTSGITPSGGTPNSASGLMDEIKIYTTQINAYQASSDMSCTALVDHLLIQSANSGLTCAENTLTIRACQNAACTVSYNSGVTGTLTASPSVTWDSATGSDTFSTNSTGTALKKMQPLAAGPITIGITSPTPVPTNPVVCNFGNNAPSNNNCVYTASTAGFIFSNTNTGSSYTIPPQTAGVATPTLYLRAVQSSTTNAAVCTPAIISQTTPVTLNYTCNNPSTCMPGNLASISSMANIDSVGVNVNLTFDANGSAPLDIRYDDVGQITMTANKTITPAFTGATPITLTGSSNPFVVAPHHFGFSNTTSTLIKAGDPFTTTITAYNGLGVPSITGNFGNEFSPEGVTLTPNLVTAGGTNPAITNNVVPGTEFGSTGMVSDANGVATVNNLIWPEVGLINLTATLTSGSYLSSGLTATGTSANVGRFTPHHFDTVVTQPTSFTYSGQPFTVKVIALNASNGITKNYNTSYGYSKNITLSAWNSTGVTANPGPGTLTNNTLLSTAFNSTTTGSATNATVTYGFTSAKTPPTVIRIKATDADSVTSTSGNEGLALERSGRLKLSNAYGKKSTNLQIPIQAQYWTGSSWLLNTDDSITNIPSSAVAINQSGVTGVSVLGSITLSNGQGNLTLVKPTTGTGYADIAINLGSTTADQSCLSTHPATTGANQAWLRSLNGSCVATYDRDPTARGSFGIFAPETNKTLHIRELF